MRHSGGDARRILTGSAIRHRHISDGIPNTLHDMASHNSQALTNPRLHEARCETTCHCERRVVPTTWDHVYDGVGETCGHPACIPPADA